MTSHLCHSRARGNPRREGTGCGVVGWASPIGTAMKVAQDGQVLGSRTLAERRSPVGTVETMHDMPGFNRPYGTHPMETPPIPGVASWAIVGAVPTGLCAVCLRGRCISHESVWLLLRPRVQEDRSPGIGGALSLYRRAVLLVQEGCSLGAGGACSWCRRAGLLVAWLLQVRRKLMLFR